MEEVHRVGDREGEGDLEGDRRAYEDMDACLWVNGLRRLDSSRLVEGIVGTPVARILSVKEVIDLQVESPCLEAAHREIIAQTETCYMLAG